MADQSILGKELGDKHVPDEAARAMSAFRSGIYEHKRYTFGAAGDFVLRDIVPDVVDGETPVKLFATMKRAHLALIRFDKDIIVRFNGSDKDPIQLFAFEGLTEEQVLEVTDIEIKTLNDNTTVWVRLS